MNTSLYGTSMALTVALLAHPDAAHAQRTKQWGADWSRCISHDQGGFHNRCTQSMEVFWLDTGGHKNQVTIRANGTYPGGSPPAEIFACLSDQGNRFDWDARRCWYWE